VIKDIVVSKVKQIEKDSRFIQTVKPLFPLLCFLGGYIWDHLTLKRIDNILDNVILLSYLVALGSLIILSNTVLPDTRKKLKKLKGWAPFAIQFLMGGLFSAYVVYYFQSMSFSGTSIFWLILVGLLVLNEFLKEQLTNIWLQLALYYMVCASFFIFAVPIVFKSIGYGAFLTAEITSFGIVMGMIYYFYKTKILKTGRDLFVSISIVSFLLLALNGLYLKNWIPPVPLSLKAGNIYHNVKRQGKNYEAQYVKPCWYKWWKKSDETFLYINGDNVYCYTAIFAPTRVNEEIFHEWQRYSKEKETWVTTDRILIPVKGGRDRGFRGYTHKAKVFTGKWRVAIKTHTGLLLGRVNLRIKPETRKNRKLINTTI
jgi:hypothetical protein